VPNRPADKSPGLFVLSFDTELAWGTFDVGGLRRYATHFAQYRGLVKRLVVLLNDYRVPATWAFVGHLLLDKCEKSEDGLTHPDVLRPRYAWYPHDWHHRDPATDVHRDPWWYGTDILDMVHSAPVKHEIATHTFSHIVVDDPACTAEIFRSQLTACAELHQRHGLEFRSIVFPRNRIAHREILAQYGIVAYRGRESRWYSRIWPEASGSGVLHILDRALPFSPPTYPLGALLEGPLVNLPASMMLLARDGFRRCIPIETRTSQAKVGLRKASERGELFHLWLHPSNLGSDCALFACLEEILQLADDLRQRGLLQILTMGEAAERIKQVGSDAPNRHPGQA